MLRDLIRFVTGPWRRRRLDAIRALRQRCHLLRSQRDYFRRQHRVAALEVAGLNTLLDAVREGVAAGRMELPGDLLDRFLRRAEQAGVAPAAGGP